MAYQESPEADDVDAGLRQIENGAAKCHVSKNNDFIGGIPDITEGRFTPVGRLAPCYPI